MFKKITKQFTYKFDTPQKGLYFISISASCKSGKLLGLFGGQDLRIEFNNIRLREVPAKKRAQHYNIPTAWNGTKLKGLTKTVIFILELDKGSQTIKFIPKRGAVIEKEPEIKLIKNPSKIRLNLNTTAENRNRQPWITLALINLPLKILDVSLTCAKRFLDSDDIKLIIDGEIQKNKQANWWGKNWYWQGRRLQGSTEETRFYPNLSKAIHYIEFWADREPTLGWVEMSSGEVDDGEEDKKTIQRYTYKGINGKENYNRFNQEIKEAVNHWNNVFGQEKDPPEELLNPNLVKAIIYKESRMGYQPGGEIDVMQVGNPADPALKTLNGELKEWEIEDGKKVQLNYSGKANANTPEDSIYWGIRWLYHKAQRITKDNKRYWRGWKEAIHGYGPGSKKYTDRVWKIYKDGIDPDGNVLWEKNEDGFSLVKTLITAGIILIAGLIGWYVGAKKCEDFYTQKELDEYTIGKKKKEENSHPSQKVREIISSVFFKDLEDYKKGKNYAFGGTLRECEKFNCINQSIFYEHYKLLVEDMHDNQHFLSAVGYLGPMSIFHTKDIDNDGENEIVFSVYDPLNRDFVSLAIIDKIDNKFQITEKRIDSGHTSYMSITDLTGDLKPEIAFFVGFGKGGYSLFVYQYQNQEIVEIFSNRDLLYPEYIFSDMNLNNRIEIKINGEVRDAVRGYSQTVQKIYEYNKTQNKFIPIQTVANR